MENVDVCELFVSIRNGLNQLPYVTSDGQVSLNLPYEAVEVTEILYEAKINEISTAKITLPSLLVFPELRLLLQKIQEGDRIEIFGNQPDCGDPLIAGFIPQNGIEEQDGKTILSIDDTLGQLRWQHLKRVEYLSGPASLLYDRARSVWRDIVIEDFLGTNPQGDYSTVLGAGSVSPVLTWGKGSLSQTGNGGNFVYPANITPFTINPGDTFLFEVDGTWNSDFAVSGNGLVQLLLGLTKTPVVNTFDAPGQGLVGAFMEYQRSGVSATPQQMGTGAMIFPTGTGPFYDPTNGGLAGLGTNAVNFGMPQSHHVTEYLRFNFDGTLSIYMYVDNIQYTFTTQPWNFDSATYVPFAWFNTQNTSESVQVSTWRVSKLVPALNRAARFNPQTTDALTYQPNNEENLQFLQLIAEKDNAEYRPLYRSRATSSNDDLELDATGTLGKFASRVLGYEQPSSLPTEGSPQASPVPVVTDLATFLTAPPFRFEEGYNLESAPRIQSRANAHANDVIRVGASTLDSQVFAEKWSAAELGRPQHSPSGALYPRFEQITNDDRVGIQSLVSSLASFELARRIDTTPSLEVAVVEEVPWAFRWRAGDQVFTKTRSLRTNLEQEMRVMKIQYKAGSPVRTVTLGKTDWDPTMLRMLAEDTKISWLYDQSGTNPGTYVYPSLGNIVSNATSPVFTIPLDQYTTGSALVYAALHWFADANVMNLQPIINGTTVFTPAAGTSGTDSGLVVCTQYFQSPGTYSLQFHNADAATRNLTGAFLVLRIRA